MESKELENYFMSLLMNDDIISYETLCKNLGNMYELSIRYWHTYEIMDINLKRKISLFLMKKCDYESYEIMDIITAIIPLLGLQELWDKIIEDKPKILDPSIISLLDDSIKDYGYNVEDPYSNMS